MNVDGWLDVTALGDGTCTVWTGNGGGQWVDAGGFLNGPAVDTAALAVGGDIDHNGYPDIAYVQEEGSWPSYQNYLYVYREITPPRERWIAIQLPRGSETFYAGSVQTIRWAAAQIGSEPAQITLELSTTGPAGPWSPVATDLPDGGHHQWIVAGSPTEEAHIRATLTQGGESVTATGAAFRILPGGSSGVQLDVPGRDGGLAARLLLLNNPATLEAGFSIRPLPGSGGILHEQAGWTISVFNPVGRLVRSLRATGPDLVWDLAGPRGRPVSAGVYLVSLADASGDRIAPVQRLVVLR
jgi:hypothetical protein